MIITSNSVREHIMSILFTARSNSSTGHYACTDISQEKKTVEILKARSMDGERVVGRDLSDQ